MDYIRRDGHETWHRLLQWTKQQTPAERLAGHILRLDGFNSLDPSHPLGGRDGLKDLIAVKDGQKWIAAAYFPRGQQPFNSIKSKFIHDSSGITVNEAYGFAFITNQELRISERTELTNPLGNVPVEIYHLERIAQILDSPAAYGVRLEFLDIPMSKEDQVSFFAWLESKNIAAVTAAFQAERRLLAEEQHRKSQVALQNHSVLLFPVIEHFRVIVWCMTTPLIKRSEKPGYVYNPDFKLSDFQGIFQPTFIFKFPLDEPTIDRYVKIQRQLLEELVSLIKLVDHSYWPELPVLCQKVITAIQDYDYSDFLLSSAKMRLGNQPMREHDVEMLKSSEEDDLVIHGSHGLDPYRALALQIKHTMPLLGEIEQIILENIP